MTYLTTLAPNINSDFNVFNLILMAYKRTSERANARIAIFSSRACASLHLFGDGVELEIGNLGQQALLVGAFDTGFKLRGQSICDSLQSHTGDFLEFFAQLAIERF